MIYGIGVDVAIISRFTPLISKFQMRFWKRAFHPAEIQYALTLDEQDQARFAASRWAAKEALTKAIGKRLLFPEMQVVRQRAESGVSFTWRLNLRAHYVEPNRSTARIRVSWAMQGAFQQSASAKPPIDLT